MAFEPIAGKPVRPAPPPGRVEVRLDESHRQRYRRLYARYATVLEGLPVLRERDFDGRRVRMTPAQLDALNRAFAALDDAAEDDDTATTPFGNQARGRSSLFKRLQYLS